LSIDEWYNKWRKMLPFGPWSFPDIDEMMKEMEKEFAELSDIEKQVPKGLVREKTEADGTVRREIGPIVYGYSVTIGPDGKPVIREFGNVKKGAAPLKGLTDQREPLVDLVDTDKEIRIIAELPGVNKDDIVVTAEGTKLTISVTSEEHKFFKELDLPAPVKPESAKSTYNNGILEITFEKEPSSGKGVRLRIE
jgi:HSP20 family protein